MFQKFERLYLNESTTDNLQRGTQFNYAWCLVRSRYSADIRKGITLLEDLFKTEDSTNEHAKRDYLYYLALGNARIKVSIIIILYSLSTLNDVIFHLLQIIILLSH